MKIECNECGTTGEETLLFMCRVCHKRFCEDHAVRRGGVLFCSLGCGEFFFHDESEDDSG
jgi:hypothetical protein